MMSDYKVEMINDGMQEFYVHFHGPNESKIPFLFPCVFLFHVLVLLMKISVTNMLLLLWVFALFFGVSLHIAIWLCIEYSFLAAVDLDFGNNKVILVFFLFNWLLCAFCGVYK